MIGELKEQIENGEYFIMARNWYADTYLAINTQLVSILTASIIVLVSCYFICSTMLDQYTPDTYRFPIYTNGESDFRHLIKPISPSNSESLDISIARYLLSFYITTREGYNYQNLAKENHMSNMLSSLRSMSSREIYAKYLRYMDPHYNATSPTLIYKDQIVRNIEIVKTSFPHDSERPGSATIFFKSTEEDSEETHFSYWRADVEFILNDVERTIKEHGNVNFMVTSYNIQEIQNIQ